MRNPIEHIVIFFADVSGSTQMYERLGDTVAHECISASLQRISEQVARHQGQVVETIGDEVMALFRDPLNAARAACAIQQQFASQPVAGSHTVKVRIGFHYGPIEFDAEGHPFGDTVNVAARVVGLCEAGRAIATEGSLAAVKQTGEFSLRLYQRARVKGKSMPLVVEEILWDCEDATSLFNLTQNTPLKAAGLVMELVYRGNRISLVSDRPAFVIGRGMEADLVVDSALASRAHARLEFRWGEVYLVDHSTNGTYVRSGQGKRESDGVPVRLHRRELLLKGKGEIGIGAPVDSADDSGLIHFEVH